MLDKYKYIVVGAGPAGLVIAERIASQLNEKVLVIEKKNHIAGHCYDYYDENGILVHKFGPHIFHTNFNDVWKYIRQFTDWREYFLNVRAQIDGQLVPVPFNLNTLKYLFSEKEFDRFSEKLIATFGYGNRIPILSMRQSEDDEIKKLAELIYDKLFLRYMEKQWDRRPEELSPEVSNRIPIEISKDDRYFHDSYQGLPKQGYTKLFENMANHENINILLQTDARDLITIDEDLNIVKVSGKEYEGHLIYTGPIDELYDYKLGELPYRSLTFDFENYNKEFYQDYSVVSYPNNFDFTRITEYKHLTGQESNQTTIIKEMPSPYSKDDNNLQRYYPIPHPDNQALYEKYLKLSQKIKNMHLIGRLAQYKYYNMDQIIKTSLDYFMTTFRESNVK